MNPRKVQLELEAYNLRKKRELEDKNAIAHLQGMYFLEALSCVASSFGKGNRHEYPSKPYDLSAGETVELTEEEKIERTKALFASLEIMATNFNNNKEKRETMQE